jgi:hypothetical protein
MMVAFIDDHRVEHGVEPICEALPIAPPTYYGHTEAVEADPELRSYRVKRDEHLKGEIRRVWEESLQVNGGPRRLLASASRCPAAAAVLAGAGRPHPLSGMRRGSSSPKASSSSIMPCRFRITSRA